MPVTNSFGLWSSSIFFGDKSNPREDYLGLLWHKGRVAGRRGGTFSDERQSITLGFACSTRNGTSGKRGDGPARSRVREGRGGGLGTGWRAPFGTREMDASGSGFPRCGGPKRRRESVPHEHAETPEDSEAHYENFVIEIYIY